MALYNRVNGRVLKEHMRAATRKRVTISFYKYHHIPDPAAFRDQLYRNLDALDVLGRIYVATEGINAQISVPEEHVDAFRTHLYSTSFLNNIRLNIAVQDDGKSFFKLKILVRKKIVADGLDDTTFDASKTGVHVNAQTFNSFQSLIWVTVLVAAGPFSLGGAVLAALLLVCLPAGATSSALVPANQSFTSSREAAVRSSIEPMTVCE